MVTRLKVPQTDKEDIYYTALEQLKAMKIGDFNELDALIEVIAPTFNCVIASVSLQDGDEIHLISSNVKTDVIIPKNLSFTQYVLAEKELVMIEDAHLDDRFENNPLILEYSQLRSFIGIPLAITSQQFIGALCLIDSKPRQYTQEDSENLYKLGQAVEGLLSSRLNALQAQIAQERAEISEQISQRREEILAEVAKVSGVGGWEFDVLTETLYWTEKTREIHGVDADYIPTLEKAYQFYAPEARRLIEEAVENGLQNSGIWEYELPFFTAKGEHIWVKATGQALYKDGQLTRLVGGFQDITQRRFEEHRARQKEILAEEKSAELNAIITNMSHGVAVFEANGRLKYWNKQCKELVPQLDQELHYGANFRSLLKTLEERDELPWPEEEFLDKILNAFQKGQDIRVTFNMKSGRIISSLYTGLPDGGWISTIEDITEQELVNKQITYAAYHDTMTGLLNRTRFNQLLTAALQQTQQDHEQQHILLLIDLDHFKEINDTYGHIIGDQVLVKTAERLTNAVRSTDAVVRLGGDEFAILLSSNQPLEEQAKMTSSRLLKSIKAPYCLDELQLTLGISIGISSIRPSDTAINDVIQRADLALYSVKKQGRDNYCIYHEE